MVTLNEGDWRLIDAITGSEVSNERSEEKRKKLMPVLMLHNSLDLLVFHREVPKLYKCWVERTKHHYQLTARSYK